MSWLSQQHYSKAINFLFNHPLFANQRNTCHEGVLPSLSRKAKEVKWRGLEKQSGATQDPLAKHPKAREKENELKKVLDPSKEFTLIWEVQVQIGLMSIKLV